MADNHKALSYRSKRRRIQNKVAGHIKDIEDEVTRNSSPHRETVDESCTVPSVTDDDLSGNKSLDCYDDDNSSVELCAPVDYDTISSSNDSEQESLADDELSNNLFMDNLAYWAVEQSISHAALLKLLLLLKPYHSFLPRDPRTLLKTPKSFDDSLKVFEDGKSQYYHFGIEHNIKNLALNDGVENKTISLVFNIDGLPLFKSSSVQLWPILCIVKESATCEPFIVGLYCGVSKPDNIQIFLSEFIDEYKRISHEGVTINDEQFAVKIDCFVCDAPARAFVKNVKLCSGYYGCEKCVQQGEWDGRVIFTNCKAALRTDVAFDEMLESDHHHGPSPLSEIGVGLVTQFPLDYMHLLCLGVVRKFLRQWIGKASSVCGRLPARITEEISVKLLSLSSLVPREFARKPRSLKEIDRWKATEFRQFLFYTGPVVLHTALDADFYRHFLLLHVAAYILASESLCDRFCDYAEKLLVTFVENTKSLYHKNMLVYNVHNLVHLANDCRRFGNLDNFSAFPFENFLQSIKKLVRKPRYPVQQIVRRLAEKNATGRFKCSLNDSSIQGVMCKMAHTMGPMPQGVEHFFQYSQLYSGTLYFSTSPSDKCIRTKDGLYGVIVNILQYKGVVKCVCKFFAHVSDFFTYPLSSQTLGICQVSRLSSSLELVDTSDIYQKCVLLEMNASDGMFVAIPLLHHQ